MNVFEEVMQAQIQLNGVVFPTPLAENRNLSEEFQAKILLKREDLQVVRSYKIRGAYNKISTLSDADKTKEIVCASAGNGQGDETPQAWHRLPGRHQDTRQRVASQRALAWPHRQTRSPTQSGSPGVAGAR